MGMCAVCLRLLAVILMLIGEWSGGLGLAAEAALHGDFAAPAQLGALPDPVREIIAQLVETVEALRAEVLELKADRGRSQERAAALETRVGELELHIGTILEKEAAEAEARREIPSERAETAEHRRLQAEQACASGQEFQAMTAAAMAACCPAQSAGGHRRFLQASCELPDTCPSMACAAVFVPFMEDCGATLARSSSVPLGQFRASRSVRFCVLRCFAYRSVASVISFDAVRGACFHARDGHVLEFHEGQLADLRQKRLVNPLAVGRYRVQSRNLCQRLDVVEVRLQAARRALGADFLQQLFHFF